MDDRPSAEYKQACDQCGNITSQVSNYCPQCGKELEKQDRHLDTDD